MQGREIPSTIPKASATNVHRHEPHTGITHTHTHTKSKNNPGTSEKVQLHTYYRLAVPCFPEPRERNPGTHPDTRQKRARSCSKRLKCARCQVELNIDEPCPRETDRHLWYSAVHTATKGHRDIPTVCTGQSRTWTRNNEPRARGHPAERVLSEMGSRGGLVLMADAPSWYGS